MKSEKSSLKKAVKAVKDVTKSIRKSATAVASKFKPAKASAPAKAASAPEELPMTRKTTTKTAPTKAKKKAPAKVSSQLPSVPPLLLEGDKPATPAASGPGQRYSLGPSGTSSHSSPGESAGELPESYGTGRLLLAARDPHWLYARWDLSREQQRNYNSLSRDRHLVLRIFVNEIKGQPFAQVHVHPESTHWFVHVAQAGTKYLAELGYFASSGKWTLISTSTATLTPPDEMSKETIAEFAAIPMDIPFTQLMELARVAIQENIPIVEILQQLRASGHKFQPVRVGGKWTPEQERALASIITMDSVRRVWMGSLEITELIRRQLQQEISSMGAAEFSAPSSPLGGISSLSSLSSPFGGKDRRKGFWFNVNAELIIYGATEPDAQVTIGGRVIKLRPDGSFSYRFSLPDGEYELPAVAISADKTDGRAADLKFSRSTEYRGEVGVHPQDSRLKPPLAQNVA